MALLGSLIGNAMSDNPQDMGDVASNYFTNRLNQDMSQYLGVNANLTPQSTTINYNDQGQPDTVTTKHSVGEPDTSSAMNYNLAPQTAGPGTGVQALSQVAPGAGVQMPQPMAQPQTTGQPTFNVGGAAPVTEQPAAPTAPVPAPQAEAEAQLPAQLAQSAQAAQAPTPPNIGTPPTPGAPTQLAANGPMPAGAVPNTPSTMPQPNQAPEAAPAAPDWHNQLTQSANDFNGLATMIAQPNIPDDVKDEAKDRLWNLMQDEKLKTAAAKKISAADNGDPRAVNELAREMSSNKKEGSYVKAILFARLGLTQLANDEQQKLGAGAKYSSYMDANGDHYTVKLGGDGAVERAFDSTGKAVDDSTLANLNANYMSMKGATTGQTMGFDKSGNVISHTVVPGTGRVIWKDETNGKILTGAPEGYHQGKNQQEMLANTSYAQTRKKLSDLNAKEVANGRAPIYTDDQIENAASKSRNDILGLPSTTYGGGGEGGVNPAPAPAAAPVGNDLSESLRGKIVSANRAPDQQAALYDETVRAGRPGVGPTGLPVARPGTSAHERGNAIDLPRNLSRAERQELAQKGYYQPEGTDSVHWERMPTANAAMTPTGGAVPGAGNPNIRDVQRSTAEAIANYQAPPLKGGGMNSQNSTIMAMVRQLNPDYDASKWDTLSKTRKDFTTGKQGDTVRSMNVAVDHLDTLSQAAQALNNGQLPVLNKIMNEFSRNTGSPAVTNFDGIKSIVGSEVAKAVSGAGGSALGDREEIRREINAANSPEQLAGVIKKYQNLMAGQLKGLRTQYEDAGLHDFDKKIAPNTKRAMDRVEQEGRNTRSSW